MEPICACFRGKVSLLNRMKFDLPTLSIGRILVWSRIHCQSVVVTSLQGAIFRWEAGKSNYMRRRLAVSNTVSMAMKNIFFSSTSYATVLFSRFALIFPVIFLSQIFSEIMSSTCKQLFSWAQYFSVFNVNCVCVCERGGIDARDEPFCMFSAFVLFAM